MAEEKPCDEDYESVALFISRPIYRRLLSFFGLKALPPYVTRKIAGREVRLLIDTYTSKDISLHFWG